MEKTNLVPNYFCLFSESMAAIAKLDPASTSSLCEVGSPVLREQQQKRGRQWPRLVAQCGGGVVVAAAGSP